MATDDQPPVPPSTEEQRRARTEEWKRNPAAFHSYLLDTLYDHLQLRDELARNPAMDPADRLRALSDFAKDAREAIEAVNGATHQDEPVGDRTRRKK